MIKAMKDKMGPGSEKSVLHQGDEGQNEARGAEKTVIKKLDKAT